MSLEYDDLIFLGGMILLSGFLRDNDSRKKFVQTHPETVIDGLEASRLAWELYQEKLLHGK